MTDKNTQIIEAAIQLFAKDGVSVPTAKIAKEAGVSNGTLFNYFATKQDLIDSVYFYIKEKMANEIVSDADFDNGLEHMLLNLWKSYVAWADSHILQHQVVDFLYSSQMLSDDVKEASHHFFIAFHETMEQAIEDKILLEAPRYYLCEIAASHLRATMSYAQSNNLKGDELDKLVEKSFEIYWNGIKFRDSLSLDNEGKVYQLRSINS